MSSDSTQPTPEAGATTTEPGDQAGRKPKSTKIKFPRSSIWLNTPKRTFNKKALSTKGHLTKAKKTALKSDGATPAQAADKSAEGKAGKKLIKSGKHKETLHEKRFRKALTEQKRQVDRLRQLKSLKKAPTVTKEKTETEGGDKKKAASEHIPKFPPVPESILRKRKYLAKIRKQHISNLKKRKKERKEKRGVIYKRARQYFDEYRRRDKELITLRRMARNSGSFFREPEPKLAIVVRIRGINELIQKLNLSFEYSDLDKSKTPSSSS